MRSDLSNYYAYDLDSFRYISHYGIKGQKWGIRRYQNPDGTRTAEGRKRAKQEYKEDNKNAYEYGREATIYDRAYGYALKNKQKAQKRYDKKQTERRAMKKKIADDIEASLREKKVLSQAKVQEHYNELIKKYGKEAISDIKYDKNGHINEKVNTGKDWAKAYVESMAALAISTAVGAPFTFIYVPGSANTKGYQVYSDEKLNRTYDERKNRKKS